MADPYTSEDNAAVDTELRLLIENARDILDLAVPNLQIPQLDNNSFNNVLKLTLTFYVVFRTTSL